MAGSCSLYTGRRDSLITAAIVGRRGVIGASAIGHARGCSHSEIPHFMLSENRGYVSNLTF